MSPEGTGATARPHPALAVAAVVVAAEGVVAAMFGRAVLVAGGGLTTGQNVAVTGFFLACAVGLMLCARGLWLRRRWARAPVVFAQLLQLGVAWTFFSGSTRALAIGLLVAALGVLVLVLSPPSTVALNRGTE